MIEVPEREVVSFMSRDFGRVSSGRAGYSVHVRVRFVKNMKGRERLALVSSNGVWRVFALAFAWSSASREDASWAASWTSWEDLTWVSRSGD